jgi:hypothetical protein
MATMPTSSTLRRITGLVLTALSAATGVAHADSTSQVTITLNDEGKRIAEQLGFDAEGFRAKAEEKLADAMQISEVQSFLRSFGNATSFSNRGTGVDYASNSERYIFGLAGNLAISANLGDDTADGTPAVGVAPTFSLMGGMNLRPWNHPELTVYANFFHSNSDSGQLRGGITNFGLHGQLKLFTPTRGVKRLFVQWGGLDVTGGLEIARWSLGLHGDLTTPFDISDTENTDASILTANVNGRFDVGSTTVTAPIEITTNLRLLYLLSLYLGGGLDVQAGSAHVDVGAGGGLKGTRIDTQREEVIGEVSASASGSNSPSVGAFHLLVGAQANLWRLKIFVQTSLQPSSSNFAVSLATGLRLTI